MNFISIKLSKTKTHNDTKMENLQILSKELTFQHTKPAHEICGFLTTPHQITRPITLNSIQKLNYSF